jgi:multiple sugar transport system permease protein
MIERRSPLKTTLSYAALIAWSLIVIVPLYWTVVTAFKTRADVFSGPKYIPGLDYVPTLEHWQRFFVQDWRYFSQQYTNSVVIGLTSSLLSVAIGALAAYALTRFKYVLGGRLRNREIAFWFVSQRILPPVAIVIPLYVLFQQVKLFDTQIGLIIAYAAFNLPLVVWLMQDYFAGIPAELEESALIDGCSRFQAFIRIVLPLVTPGLVATFLFVLVFAWNEYIIALFLTQSNAQTMPILIAAQNAQRGPEWSAISVLTIVTIAPVCVIAVFLERYISRGLLVGAVKG